MGVITSNLIVVISLMINVWGINFEYIEVKTDGDCNYVARYYLPNDQTKMIQFFHPVYKVNSPYSDEKMQKEIAGRLNSYDCIRETREEDNPIDKDSITLMREFRFPCCPDFVLLEYSISRGMGHQMIGYIESEKEWYFLSGFCGGSLIENYNKMIEKNRSALDMPITCRAMFVLSLVPGLRWSDILKSSDDLLFDGSSMGLMQWALYRYNIKKNGILDINLFPPVKPLPAPDIDEEWPTRGEVTYEKLIASGKTIKSPYVTQEGDLDIVHLVIYPYFPEIHSDLGWWEVSFNRYTGKLFDIKKVDYLK